MNMISCKNGHYYNQDKNDKCPYCDDYNSKLNIVSNKLDYEETQIIDLNKFQKDNTSTIGTIKVDGDETKILSPLEKNKENMDKKKEIVELAGWIVIISNQGKGKVYNITYGLNTIGRGNSNAIIINNGDSSISREKHSSIIYDFENNQFFIQHHDGKYLTYLNKKLVMNLTELRPYDKIKIGKTEFIFVPLCGENFKWKDDEN